jgi:hypothetical protein
MTEEQTRKKVIAAFKGFIKTYRLEPLSVRRDSLEPKYFHSWRVFSDDKDRKFELYYRVKSHNEVLKMIERLFPEQTDRKLVNSILLDAINSWITEGKDANDQEQLEQAGSQFISEIEKQIMPRKLFVPIDGLEITSLKSLKVANCEIFNNHERSEWRQLVEQHRKRFSEEVSQPTKWYEEVKVYFTVDISAHPGRAVERAIEETNLALSILRLFVSSYYFHEHEQSMVRRLGLFGSLNTLERRYVWYTNPDLPIEEQYPGGSESSKILSNIEIDTEFFEYMKRFGLERINDLIQSIGQSRNNDIARRILRAISWYSKATSARSITDSYLMYAIAIEALLSEDRTPQETYSTQMAALVTCENDDCLIYPVGGYISSSFSKQLKKASSINDRFNLIYQRALDLFTYRNRIAHGAVLDAEIDPGNLLDFETIVKNSIMAFVIKNCETFGIFKNWVRNSVRYDYKPS